MINKVLIIFSSHNNKFKVCNGVYVGEKIPTHEKNRNTMADWLRDKAIKNPCIETNTGLIWGCECWWSNREPTLKQLRKQNAELEYITVEEFFKRR